MVRPPNPELVESILEAAVAVIGERGAQDVTLRDVAKRAMVTATTVHYYYQSREGLLEAARQRLSSDLDAYCAAAIGQDSTAAQQLRNVSHAYVDWAYDHPLEAAFLAILPTSAPAGDAAQPRRLGLRQLEDIYDRGVASGEFSIPNTCLHASAHFAALVGIAYLYLSGQLPAERRAAHAVADVTVRTVLALVAPADRGMRRQTRRSTRRAE